MPKKSIYVLVFVAILSGSIFVRMHHLDRFGFWSDELYHVIAAQGMLKDGRPLFPGGIEYSRALSFTFLVSQSFKVFGINETAARIPSVLFNVVFLLAGFFIVKNWFNTNVALMFLTAMGFSNFQLLHTRQSRMYTAFQLFYFLGTYLFWLGLERKHTVHDKDAFFKNILRYGDNVAFLLLSMIMLLVARHFHQLTIFFGFVLVTYVFSLFLLELKEKSGWDSIRSKYGILTVAFLAIGLLILMARPEFYVHAYHRAGSLPAWKKSEPVNIKLFFGILRSESPIFFFLYPISALYLLTKDIRKGLFIVISFVVPFILHSFIFDFKEDRFMIYFYPFYIITIMVFLERVITYAWDAKENVTTGIASLDRLIPICTLFSFLIFLYPWFFESRNIHNKKLWIDWKPSLTDIYPKIDNNSTIITLLDDQSFLYYYLRRNPDYFIAPITYYEGEEAEYQYFDSKPIRSLAEFQSVSEKHNDVWLIANKDEFYNESRYFRRNIWDLIANSFIAYPARGDKRILIFRKDSS